MGVELAAECHLDRSRQAATLLAAQKNDVAALGATCYKLNSLQVRHLLTHFVAQDGEIPCDNDVITRIVGLSERQADALTLQVKSRTFFYILKSYTKNYLSKRYNENRKNKKS
ncbi:unnamed protein product [Cylicostephanus goldi]|uniref:Dilute domain-containing protein n=1 Tax=Cylicostephanus goldi TaxID=71465 RepID=A0A3P7LZX2_CYLGO|nr:unnamed protein product [Cylicostephanus goldi]